MKLKYIMNSLAILCLGIISFYGNDFIFTPVAILCLVAYIIYNLISCENKGE